MLVDMREQHQAVLEWRQHGYAEACDIGPFGARNGVVNGLVKEMRLLLVGACAEIPMQLDFGTARLLEARVARIDFKLNIVFPFQALHERKCSLEVVRRHDEVDVAHAAAVRLRVIRRSSRTLQHGNGDACLAKLGEYAVLRHHEAIPARQVFPGARKVFRLVGRGELEGFDGVCRIADDGLCLQLGPHGRPQTVRDGWNGE